MVERPNSYYYFVKEKEENIGFLRVQTNEELTKAWLGTAAILPQYQGKGYGSEGLRLLEKEFPTIKQWDLCTVLQDAGMVAFYEKNGYRQTHIEPEKEGMDMVYMKKLIDKKKRWFAYISKLNPPKTQCQKHKLLLGTSVFREFLILALCFTGLVS